jgi:DNA-binding CsgD family transcriptional regulator
MKRSTLRRRNRQETAPYFNGLQTVAAGAAMKKLGLTEREAQVLLWLASGKTNAEIAIILGLSFYTVKTHVKNILRRLEVDTRTAAAATLFRALSGAAK